MEFLIIIGVVTLMIVAPVIRLAVTIVATVISGLLFVVFNGDPVFGWITLFLAGAVFWQFASRVESTSSMSRY
jgi:hypothetical protein